MDRGQKTEGRRRGRSRSVRSPEPDARDDFFERVWDVVARIPPGRVTTYGHIAAHLGTKGAARTVGYALNAAARADAGPLGLPCHRVVNRSGALTGRLHFETPDVMEERLRAEGVAFADDGRVDLERHLWVPEEPVDGGP